MHTRQVACEVRAKTDSLNSASIVPHRGMPHRGKEHAAHEHPICPMHFCLACRASKHRLGKSAALHMAKNNVGGLRGAANTACVLSQFVPHLRGAH
jgi:hypothetical protein